MLQPPAETSTTSTNATAITSTATNFNTATSIISYTLFVNNMQMVAL